MYMGRDFSPQQRQESEVFGIDFVNDLEHEEQLLDSIWTIEVVQGYDPAPQYHLEGPCDEVVPFGSNLKTATIQRIGGLWPDVTYKLEATVTTNQGNSRSLWSKVRGVDS